MDGAAYEESADMTEPANSYQVGGTHYKNVSYEHWDLVLRTGMGYLEGVATKYIARWRKSGEGDQDLRKALHYVQKMRENIGFIAVAGRRPLRGVRWEVGVFCEANGLFEFEACAIMQLATWESDRDLLTASNSIEYLLKHVPNKPLHTTIMSADPKPVPLVDSNKHAERS
jgi:hypothetical protein